MLEGIRTVEQVLIDLGDRTKAEAAATKVNKGNKGTFTYIPWNETAKLLSDVFGVFGWSATIIHSDYHNGVYTVDLDLEVRATTAQGGTLSKHVPGRGVGTLKLEYLDNPDMHDTAAKAARSDALSTAAKMLGDAFGLYLYDKGDPARNAAQNTAFTPGTALPSTYGAASSTGQATDRRPSEKQQMVLTKNGYSEAQVATLTFQQWKGVLDALFSKQTPEIAPARALVPAGGPDEFPF
jgi:hypothetical protein